MTQTCGNLNDTGPPRQSAPANGDRALLLSGIRRRVGSSLKLAVRRQVEADLGATEVAHGTLPCTALNSGVDGPCDDRDDLRQRSRTATASRWPAGVGPAPRGSGPNHRARNCSESRSRRRPSNGVSCAWKHRRKRTYSSASRASRTPRRLRPGLRRRCRRDHLPEGGAGRPRSRLAILGNGRGHIPNCNPRADTYYLSNARAKQHPGSI